MECRQGCQLLRKNCSGRCSAVSKAATYSFSLYARSEDVCSICLTVVAWKSMIYIFVVEAVTRIERRFSCVPCPHPFSLLDMRTTLEQLVLSTLVVSIPKSEKRWAIEIR